MSDNLKLLEQKIEADIDPNGAPGSILALNHQDILKQVLSKAGKWTGVHFVAEKDPAEIITGKLSFNGNAFNNIANFVITISKLTSDLNDAGDFLKLYSTGTMIHFKDYVGRSALFEFQSYVADDDGMGNDTYDITVKGLATNINYVYQDAESELASLSFYSAAPAALKAKIKAINFGTATYSGNTLEVASKINALADQANDYKTVAQNEIVMFWGMIATKPNNQKFVGAVYVVPGEVAGIYGVNGDIVLTDAELLNIENGGAASQPPDPSNDPNAHVENLGEIANGDWLSVINSEPNPYFVITAGTNWYFDLTVGGAQVILAHDGPNGTYGDGQDQMLASELLIIYDERVVDPDARVDLGNVSGNAEINWAAGSVFEATMTANTAFSQINLPTGTETKTITVYLKGDFTPTMPAQWGAAKSGIYDGLAVENQYVVECRDGDNDSYWYEIGQ